MSSMIIRIYDSAATATAAAKDLTNAGFEHVQQFKSAGGKGAMSAASRTKLVEEMMKAHIWRSHADIYADRLATGGALVMVHAPFGAALNAAEIMDAHDPMIEGITSSSKHREYTWDEATPFSSALQIPVLTKMKLPAEEFSGVKSLSKGLMSDFIGIELLTAGAAHKTQSMGLPLLSHSATPLSSLFGMKTLSRNPTPLSSLFGMKVLSRQH
jgi:hypothetical protein